MGPQFAAMQNGEFLNRIWKHECLHGCEGGDVVTAQNLVQDESVEDNKYSISLQPNFSAAIHYYNYQHCYRRDIPPPFLLDTST